MKIRSLIGVVGCILLSLITARSATAQVWQARYNMTIGELDRALEELTPEGYAPTEMSAVQDGLNVRFAAVWVKEPQVDWRSEVLLTSKQMEAKSRYLGSLGFSPQQFFAYNVDGTTKYGAIWRRSRRPWQLRYDLTSAEFQSAFDQFTGEGYVPVSLTGYKVGGENRYGAVWEKRDDSPAWQARYDLSESQYQATFDSLTPQGYVPIDISVYDLGGQPRYAAIWERVSGTSWEVRSGMSLHTHTAFTTELREKGYSPYVIAPYVVEGEIQFAGAWRYIAPSTITSDLAAEVTTGALPLGNRSRLLDIRPVMQQTPVWCWLAVGEMVFSHYGVKNVNPGGNFQCGIIGGISDPSSPCASNCFDCVMPSGSNYGTVAMLTNYARKVSGRTVRFSEGGAISPQAVISNLDAGRPILAGTSYYRRTADADAEHVSLIVGYELQDGDLWVLVNDPFPYPLGGNPFLAHGGSVARANQYRIRYDDFRAGVFWHWSVFNLEI